MPIRIIQPPKTIAVTRPNGESQPYTFAEFVLENLLNLPAWMRDYASVRSAAAIESAVKAATGGAVELAEEDWARLVAVARDSGSAAGYGLQPWGLRQLLPYFDAIIEAKAKDEHDRDKRGREALGG